MFFDRDERSARAIAGLRCIKLSGRGRPSAFRRKGQRAAAGVQSLGAVTPGGVPEVMRPVEGILAGADEAPQVLYTLRG